VAVAFTVTIPDTVDPSAGDEINTLGFVVSLPRHPWHPFKPVTNKARIIKKAINLNNFFIPFYLLKNIKVGDG
jgi:hypothetical protein